MKNLKIWQKLMVLALLGATPVIVLMFLFVTSRNEQITKSRAELAALESLQPVRRLLEHLAQHRALANVYLTGDMSVQNELARLQRDVTADVQEIAASTGKQKEFGKQWDQITATWNILKAGVLTMPPSEAFALHTAAVQNTLALIRQMGDTSGLTMDPDVESFYLADNLLVQVVQTAEALEELRAQGASSASKGRLSSEDTARMMFLSRQIENTSDIVERNAEMAMSKDKAMRETLEPKVRAARENAGYYSKLTRFQFIEGTPSVSAKTYYEDGSKAVAAYFAVWDASSSAIAGLVEARIEELNSQKWLQLGFVLCILLLAGLFTSRIQRGITQQVSNIMGLLRAIDAGDFRARAEVLSGDELGSIAQGLNGTLDSTLSLMQSREERDQIQHSIQRLLDEVSGVAEGDLRKEAEVTADITGAIADSFNYMMAELRTIISTVQKTTFAVNNSANQVQTTAEVLARGSEEQSVQIIQASSAIEQMAGSIQQVSKTASSAAVVAQEALGSAQQGAQSVRKTIEGMNAIRGQVQETSKRIKRLGESSQEIGEIVELIGDIADRTSILALNASIQAAMAGEAGKGFAVVADEVERLAERSTEATKRIGALIKSVQGDMTEAISAMEETTREVVGGSQLANEAGQRLSQIEAVSKSMADLVSQISLAAQQQAVGSDAVARNVTGISDVTQQTAVGAKQAASSIRQLAALAEELNRSVSRFKLPASDSRTPLAA
ncbi:HAMP domain-containing methyl-accepting chemotaxis protein [uncultured Paludibaculum sp.]|uniref:methyl-accepting chemotaxis protein n=1 Tax=uncultured Paludibaculum sp. TaxID=1765020 RepID=UPI002AAB227E|nr:HAMP domain-containing methyl-accepting chemotaxis protein [uncultured Paludibaculum sp.]